MPGGVALSAEPRLDPRLAGKQVCLDFQQWTGQRGRQVWDRVKMLNGCAHAARIPCRWGWPRIRGTG